MHVNIAKYQARVTQLTPATDLRPCYVSKWCHCQSSLQSSSQCEVTEAQIFSFGRATSLSAANAIGESVCPSVSE